MIQLVNMPFGSIMRSSLALGLFKAQCGKAGLPARVHNLNFAFARSIGFGAYEMIARFKGRRNAGQRVALRRGRLASSVRASGRRVPAAVRQRAGHHPQRSRSAALAAANPERLVGPYLEQCVDRLTASGVPKVVGFSCMFFQTIAALALGRRLRERFPAIKLVYGGPVSGEMGEELFAKVPWIDAVSTGEADTVIVPLLQSLSAGEVPRELPGILARDPQGTTFIGPPAVPPQASF